VTLPDGGIAYYVCTARAAEGEDPEADSGAQEISPRPALFLAQLPPQAALQVWQSGGTVEDYILSCREHPSWHDNTVLHQEQGLIAWCRTEQSSVEQREAFGPSLAQSTFEEIFNTAHHCLFRAGTVWRSLWSVVR